MSTLDLSEYVCADESFMISKFVENHPIASILASAAKRISDVNNDLFNEIGLIINNQIDFKLALKNANFWDFCYDRSWLFRKQMIIRTYTGFQLAAGINKTLLNSAENPVINDDFELDLLDSSFHSISSNPFATLPSFLFKNETQVDDSFIIVKKPLFTRRKLEYEPTFSTRSK